MTLAIGTALKEVKEVRASQEDGFTLTELLVVILIIGILGAIAVPSLAASRKETKNSEVKTTISAVAGKAITKAAGNFRSVDLEAFRTEIDSPLLTPGTIVGMTSNGLGVCLTAYHPESDYTSTKPFIYDSALVASPHVISQDKLTGTGACSTSVWGTPITPAYKVTDAGKLLPVTPVEELPDACNGIRPYKYMDTFSAVTTTGEYITLIGSLELTGNCEALKYAFRVDRAVPGKTYAINFSTSNETPGTLSTGVSRTIVLTGSAVSAGTIPTNWSGQSSFTELVVNGHFTLEPFYSSPVSWKLASEYQSPSA